MKLKFIGLICLTILLGYVTAKCAQSLYIVDVGAKTHNSYFLQSGVYKNEDSMKKEFKKLNDYITEKVDDKYYVYVGITTNIDNAKKIKNLYKSKNIDIYIKEGTINNVEFISNLEQYDILLSEVNKSDDILSINKVILSSYEETVLGNL